MAEVRRVARNTLLPKRNTGDVLSSGPKSGVAMRQLVPGLIHTAHGYVPFDRS